MDLAGTNTTSRNVSRGNRKMPRAVTQKVVVQWYGEEIETVVQKRREKVRHENKV